MGRGSGKAHLFPRPACVGVGGWGWGCHASPRRLKAELRTNSQGPPLLHLFPRPACGETIEKIISPHPNPLPISWGEGVARCSSTALVPSPRLRRGAGHALDRVVEFRSLAPLAGFRGRRPRSPKGQRVRVRGRKSPMIWAIWHIPPTATRLCRAAPGATTASPPPGHAGRIPVSEFRVHAARGARRRPPEGGTPNQFPRPSSTALVPSPRLRGDN